VILVRDGDVLVTGDALIALFEQESCNYRLDAQLVERYGEANFRIPVH
jgi:hypothetical protein